MAAGMAFCLLGPLTVRVDGAAVRIPRGKQRVILAALLLHADQTVTADRLAELLWCPVRPSSAAVTLQNYVKRLRHALGPGRDRIVTRPGGYSILLEPGELDITVMTAAVVAAGRAARAGAWPVAARQADAALALWRGVPLCGIDSDDLAALELPRLTELRFQARELRLEAGLELGEHAELVAEARQLAVESPLRERPHVLLMRALHGSGRQAEALEAYQDVRRTLVEELGCEPGPELQHQHQRILAGDPELPGKRSGAAMAGARHTQVPQQLPSAVPGFVGRAAELQTLCTWIADADAPVAGVISGPAGVGKTSLAVRWARQVADVFPDGQVFLDLNGFGPAGEPVTPADAMRRVLEALQIPLAKIPADLQGRIGFYRSVMSQRRVLVVLDNARDEDQVRPLLPGGAGSVALITSRAALAGLVALNGARVRVLQAFSDDEALEMVSQRLGPGKASPDEVATARLIAACARLPLALAIATALVATGPARDLADVASDLAPAGSRLEVLNAGEQMANIRSVFSWSYRALSPAAAQLFRLLAEQPGPDISAAAAASLTGLPLSQVRATVGELTGLHLVIEHTRDRFSLHDLLRLYTAEMLAADEPAPERHDAARRMLDFYLHSAWAAARALSPGRPGPRLATAAAGAGAEEFRDDAHALAWLVAEHHVLTRIIAYAAGTGADEVACDLALALTDFFDRGGHWSDMAATQRTALAAAQRRADVRAQARAHQYVGRACFQLQEFDAALEHLHRGLNLVPGTVGEASMRIDLTRIHKRMGDIGNALQCAERALALYQSEGHRVGQVIALNAVGWCLALRGEFAAAVGWCEQAVALSGEIDHKSGEAQAHEGLGYVRLRLGRPAAAISEYRQAISIYGQMRDRHSTALAHSYLGDAFHAAHDIAAARDAWSAALAIFDELEHPDGDGVREKLAQAAAGD
jgi:DNA-binding SARP family transcriptional activator/tetratricopeptide (TPR) repeat protein